MRTLSWGRLLEQSAPGARLSNSSWKSWKVLEWIQVWRADGTHTSRVRQEESSVRSAGVRSDPGSEDEHVPPKHDQPKFVLVSFFNYQTSSVLHILVINAAQEQTQIRRIIILLVFPQFFPVLIINGKNWSVFGWFSTAWPRLSTDISPFDLRKREKRPSCFFMGSSTFPQGCCCGRRLNHDLCPEIQMVWVFPACFPDFLERARVSCFLIVQDGRSRCWRPAKQTLNSWGAVTLSFLRDVSFVLKLLVAASSRCHMSAL